MTSRKLSLTFTYEEFNRFRDIIKSIDESVLFQETNIIHKSSDCIIMVDVYPTLDDGIVTLSFPDRMCVLMFHFQEWEYFRDAFIRVDNVGTDALGKDSWDSHTD